MYINTQKYLSKILIGYKVCALTFDILNSRYWKFMLNIFIIVNILNHNTD